MSKRFTDTLKWDDPWFRKLKPEHKCFWLYLCDKCDGAGIWKEDLEDASFRVGQPLVKASTIMAMEGRIEVFEYGSPAEYYWLIPKFLFFQIKELKKDYNPHLGIFHSLKKYNLTLSQGLVKGSSRVGQDYQDTNTDTNTGTSKDKGKDKDNTNSINSIISDLSDKFKIPNNDKPKNEKTFIIDGQKIHYSFMQKVLKECKGDHEQMARVFYRAHANNAQRIEAWIEKGMGGDKRYAFECCADEYDNPKAVREWMLGVFK